MINIERQIEGDWSKYYGKPFMHVYSLSDPRNNLVRYIGISYDPEKRYKSHLSWRHDEKWPWVFELKGWGLKPVLGIVEANIWESIAREREAYWITCYRDAGHPLLNSRKNPYEFHYIKRIAFLELIRKNKAISTREIAKALDIGESTASILRREAIADGLM